MILLGGVASGCAGVIPGTPRALPSIDVRGLDPCLALTHDQERELGVGQPIPTPVGRDGGAGCQWNRTTAEPVGVYYVEGTDKFGIRALKTDPQDSRPFLLAGFAAVHVQSAGGRLLDTCQLAVDIAAEQTLEIAYTYFGKAPDIGYDASCRQARTAAEMVLRTLLDRAGD